MNSVSEHFPTIQTERCLLRKIVSSDQPKIFEGLSHPEVIKYYGVSYSSYEEAEAQMNFYNDLLSTGTGIWWAICQKQTAEFIGACGFNNWMKEHRRAEIGFWLLPEFQRKGYMTEAVKGILEFGISAMNLHRVEAIVESDNESSSKLLKKLGFIYEGTHRECEIKNDRFIGLDYYALLGRKEDKGSERIIAKA